ncbi:MAG: DUF2027 domain-containing protein [Prevotellaceae bacterium]|jgi:hypothetical protein|nr:DUF2027 domain-containing protein [Prevotellaceae bacterium]
MGDMMKYSVGDKVRFLNDVGGGTISAILGSGKVSVTDEDGFEIPVSVTDIIVVGWDNEYGNASSDLSLRDELLSRNKVPEQEEIFEPQPEAEVVDSDDYEILLAFVPAENRSNPADSNMDLFFINDSSFYCTYTVAYRTVNDKLNLLGHSTVEPEMKEYVCSIDKTDFGSKLNLNIISCLYKYREYRYYPPAQVNVDFNPVKFFKKNSFVDNDFFDEKAYILKIAASSISEPKIEIDPRELEEAIKQKEPVNQPPKDRSNIKEVDLHIEELLDDTRGLDNAQILEIQKSRFITALEAGFCSKTEKIVFIHGVGNGKLKHEIRRLLDTQYVGLARYYDASFQKYGFGATMVILR